MELINTTGMQAGYTQGLQTDGRELLVVVVKGTFAIPEDGEEPTLAEEQVPLIMADTFVGEPARSSPVYEIDFAPTKKRCDVLLNGTAYAPGGKPTRRMTVGLKVGGLAKAFDVVGDRVWEAGASGIGPSYAAPFVTKSISYERAFGGIDDFHGDPSKHSAYMLNPVGCGYHSELSGGLVDGTPMPNTEERSVPVTQPHRTYHPMSFGPVGRGWEPRYRLSGTYDQDWLDNVFPFLPADFDDAYYQSAPPDQQTNHLLGGEEVTLVNLTADGRRSFRLPKVEVPIVFFPKKGDWKETAAVADTLLLEPDAGTFSICWRASLPLKRNMFEIAQVLTGRMSRGWWIAQEVGKTYYSSLSAAIRANRGDTVGTVGEEE
jgi:hypothetical protein